jgi:hypothetical protein
MPGEVQAAAGEGEARFDSIGRLWRSPAQRRLNSTDCFMDAPCESSFGLQILCALAFSTESAEGKTTTVNQYSAIERTTLMNCSKSTGLMM